MHRHLSGALTVAATLCLTLALAGCGDDEGESDAGPRETPTSAAGDTSPTGPASPTDESPSVAPASGPRLAMEQASLRLPEGWQVDNDDSDIVVVGLAKDLSAAIYLNSFPSLDSGASLEQLARSTQRTGDYPPGSIRPETTLAGEPAFHLAGQVGDDYSEEFGLLHDGDIVSVEFVHRSGPRAAWSELVASVLATVELR